MASIILPPIPPRPAPAIRPTMHPELETPGNKGTKVRMIQGPGTEPGPQPEPVEPLTVADGKGANWVGTNVYQIGRTVEGRTAEYEGGVEPLVYRYRFQTKATGADTWVNQPWTDTNNEKNPVYFKIVEAGQLKLQSQARDSSEPAVQLNSITGIKTIQPQTTIGDIVYLVNGIEAANNAATAVSGSSINVDCTTSGGTATDMTYFWKIRSGNASITGSTSNRTCSVSIGNEYPGSVQVQCTISSGNSSNSPASDILTVVVVEAMSLSTPQAF